jgi:hypothetical protein
MFFTRVRPWTIAARVAALSLGVAMYAVQAANGFPVPEPKAPPVALAPVDRFVNTAMPQIGEAHQRVLVARIKADDNMKSLLQDHFNAVLGEARARWMEFMHGRGTLDFLYTSLEHLLLAECDLSDQKADHVAALVDHLKRMREIEKVQEHRFIKPLWPWPLPIQDVLGPRFYRLQAEIRLEHARRDLAKPSPEATPVPLAPVDRAAADAHRNVEKELADLLTNTANIEMPGIGEARVKALLARYTADDKMKALLKDQFDAVLGDARARWLDHMNGLGTLNILYTTLEHLLLAECDLSDQKADHVAALLDHLKRMREIEKVMEERFKNPRWQKEIMADVLESRFYRLQAEIRLERAGRWLAKVGPKTTAAPVAPADQAIPDNHRDVEKALADLLTTSNAEMPETGETRLKALVAQAKTDDKMKALLKDQLDAVLGEARARWLEFMKGRGVLNFLYTSLEHLLLAECDLSDEKAGHVAALEQHSKRLREIETVNEQRGGEGRLDIQDVLESRFYRLQAKIRLERARRGLAKQDP